MLRHLCLHHDPFFACYLMKSMLVLQLLLLCSLKMMPLVLSPPLLQASHLYVLPSSTQSSLLGVVPTLP